MRIVVLDGYVENPGDLSWEPLGALGELTVYDRTPPAQVAERIGEAEIVFTNKSLIPEQVLDACPALRYIGVLATGYNVVDVEAAGRRGIVVTNIPSYGTETVAQFTMALLLEICHQIGHHSREVHAGRWSRNPDFSFWDTPQLELAGKTLGLIGYGRIGRAVGRLARAFGMEVQAWTRTPRPEEGCRMVSREELFATSDVISLHCPLTEENRGLINRETIRQMKDGVILLNTARGPLVVERDLREALDAGKVYAAGMDVASTEPIGLDNPLLGAPNCLITPHIAWATRAARQRLMDTAVENLRRFLEGQPVNRVDR